MSCVFVGGGEQSQWEFYGSKVPKTGSGESGSVRLSFVVIGGVLEVEGGLVSQAGRSEELSDGFEVFGVGDEARAEEVADAGEA